MPVVHVNTVRAKNYSKFANKAESCGLDSKNCQSLSYRVGGGSRCVNFVFSKNLFEGHTIGFNKESTSLSTASK